MPGRQEWMLGRQEPAFVVSRHHRHVSRGYGTAQSRNRVGRSGNNRGNLAWVALQWFRRRRSHAHVLPVIIVSVSFRPSAQLGCLLLPGELILRPFLNPMRASHPLVLHVPHPHTLEPCTACHRPAPPDSRGAPRAWCSSRPVGTQYPVLQHRGQGASRGRRASEAVRSVMSG